MLFFRQKRVGAQRVFAYLVGDPRSGQALAIDPAAEAPWLVEEAGREGLTITAIVNTHGHADHTCGNAALRELTGAEIILGRGDEKFLAGVWAEVGVAGGFCPSPRPDRLVGEGDVIACGSLSLQVMATPGHSPGGICLRLPGHLFTGDTILVRRAGLADIPGGSWSDLARSFGRIMALPPETRIWPGHQLGRDTFSTIAAEQEQNPFWRLVSRIDG